MKLQWAELYDKLYAFANDTSNPDATVKFPASLATEQVHQLSCYPDNKKEKEFASNC